MKSPLPGILESCGRRLSFMLLLARAAWWRISAGRGSWEPGRGWGRENSLQL